MIADLKRIGSSRRNAGMRWLVPAFLAILAVIMIIVFTDRGNWKSAREPVDLSEKLTMAAQDNPSFSIYSSSDSLAVDDTAMRTVRMLRGGPVDSVAIGKFYGLMIGVQNYTERGLAPLTQTLSDIQRMADVLNKNYIFDTILLVRNPTRREVFAVMKRMAAMLEENDNFLLFYAGHGEVDVNGDQGYWLPIDAEMKNSANWISNNDIKHFIYGLKARHILVISDACFGGSIISMREVRGEIIQQFDRFTLKSFRLKSRTSISSSFGEPVPDRSSFLNYLIDNLNANDEPILTDEQLYNLTLESMRQRVDEDIPKPYFAPIKDVGDNSGNFIFIRKTSGPPI
jgi:hypothetical protein